MHHETHPAIHNQPHEPEGEKGGLLQGLKEALFSNQPMQLPSWIILINVTVFIAMAINGAGIFDTDMEKAVQWGAAWKRLVMEGQYWRLLTACFIHFGIVHLFANMVALIYASVFLMLYINRWQFLTGYLASGVFSFAVSMWWHNETISAGASGAIFGCYGMLTGLAFTPLIAKEERRTVLIYLGIYVGFNLLYGLKEGVDNAAHVGGLLSGIVIGLIYYLPLRRESSNGVKLFSYVAVLAVCLGGAFLILKNTYYYGTDFFRLDDEYTRLEKQGLEYFNTEDTTYANKLQLLNKGTLAFQQAQLVADSIDAVKNKPDYEELYAQRLVLYTAYRVQEFDLIKQAYDGKSAYDSDSIVEVRHVIDSLIKVFHEADNSD